MLLVSFISIRTQLRAGPARYGYDAAGQLVLSSVTSAWLPASVSLSYDANGNLLGDGQKHYAYDDFNQLSSVWAAGQWKSDFVYDGLGRRRIARDYAWSGGGWQLTNETHYLCDGLLPIQELAANNAVRVSYTRGLDLSRTFGGAGGIGGLLARTDGSGSAFYHADLGGNITSLTDAGGNVVARYLYDPFGGLLGKWGALADANRYRFSSKELHPASGMYYYGYRFFDSNLQRWINRDPIGEAGGINLYGFVGNGPINAVDTFGLDSMVPGTDGTQENTVPAVRLTQPVGGGLVTTSYPGPDALLLIGGMGIGGMGFAGLGPGGMLFASASILDEFTPSTLPPGTQMGVVPSWLVGPTGKCVRDFPTSNTKNWGALFGSEGEARALARAKLGRDAVEVGPGKWRSSDGKWQYRAKPGDVADRHVHLEELDPYTGEVLQNFHLYWPEDKGR